MHPWHRLGCLLLLAGCLSPLRAAGQVSGEAQQGDPEQEPPDRSRAPLVAIDEVLADPGSGSAGDANNDGQRHSYEDEFVELVNVGADSVDLAGWTLGDASGKKAVAFPSGAVLAPGSRAVVFGGGVPRGIPGLVYAAGGRIGDGLNNGGDLVWLADAEGDTLARLSGVDWDHDQSVVRFPAGAGEFVPHTAPPGRGERFSPGSERAVLQELRVLADPGDIRVGDTLALAVTARYSDGVRTQPQEGTIWTLSDAAMAAVRDGRLLLRQAGQLRLWATYLGLQSDALELVVQPPMPRPPRPRPPVVITEVLADPPAGPAGDANSDGRTDPEEDEFVEMLNVGGEPVDLSGWRLSDDDTSLKNQFCFPPGTVLGPGEYLVLFGGGSPKGVPGLVFVDDGRLGNGLSNSGDRLLLLAGDPPDTLFEGSYTSPPNPDQSLVFVDGVPLPHERLPGRGVFSPGRPRPLYTSFAIDTLRIVAGREPAPLVLRGYPGAESLDPSLAAWRSWEPEVIDLGRTGRVRPLRPGQAQVFAWVEPGFLAEGVVLVDEPPPPPNQPPRLLSSPDTTVYAGGHYRYQAKSADPEKATLVYTLAQAPPWLRLHYADGLLWGQAPLDGPAQVEVMFEVADGRGGWDSQGFVLRVLPRPSIRIREVLVDPPPGDTGDANGDSQRQTYADEFVELVNEGPDPMDLAGWRLSDGDAGEQSQFCFPGGAVLDPGQGVVVFGGGSPQGVPGLVFADDGRLGDGLGNLQDEVYLIAPEGPDTLAQVSYRLEREANQSLCFEDGQEPPVLHSGYPGRDLFSPGRSRPVLQALRLATERLFLVRGERVQLALMGLFSDGRELEVEYEASWTSSDAAVRLSPTGALEAVRPGTAQVRAQVDRFAPPACRVQVDPPLSECVRFSPVWKQMAAPPERELVFAVLDSATTSLSCTWYVDGQAQARQEARLAFRCRAGRADTVRVEVRRRREVISRQWVLRPNLPPVVDALADTLAWVDRLYRAQIRARDPDGDALFYVLDQAPRRVHLDPEKGRLSWMPALGDTGRFPVQVRVLDGSQEAVATWALVVLPVPAKPAGDAEGARAGSWPNPFHETTTLCFDVPDGPADVVVVKVYDLAGQLVRVLLDRTVPPGRQAVVWDGWDDGGRAAAAGVYLYQVRCGGQYRTGKLLRLR